MFATSSLHCLQSRNHSIIQTSVPFARTRVGSYYTSVVATLPLQSPDPADTESECAQGVCVSAPWCWL